MLINSCLLVCFYKIQATEMFNLNRKKKTIKPDVIEGFLSVISKRDVRRIKATFRQFWNFKLKFPDNW